MKRALVLSGGGAKGAFELGALEYIQQQRPEDFKFDIIAGVSVGSLNGAMLAQNQFEQLQNLWNKISNKKVYSGKLSMLHAAWRIITGNKSVLGIEPLVEQIRTNIDIRKIEIDYRCGFVSLISGDYVSCKHIEFGDNNDNFRKAILSSCTMPIIWEPVDKLTVGQNSYFHLVDGGVRNISPLKDIIADNPDETIIINCSTKKMDVNNDAAKNILEIAKRSLIDITLNEIFLSDIEEFIKINEIVEQCDHAHLTVYKDKDNRTKPYKHFKAIVIEPKDDLGDTLDFSIDKIKERRLAGYNAAQAAYIKYNPAESFAMVRSYK